MPDAAPCTPFSFTRNGAVAELRLREKPLFLAADLEAKDALMARLDEVSLDPDLKVLVVYNATDKTGCREYFDFYRRLLDPATDKFFLAKMLYSFDQFILKLAEMPKVVIHVDCGQVLTQFLCVSLACDYRIVTEDTVYQKAYHAVGMIPKGGGPYLLARHLGPSKAFKLLLSEADLPAENAMALGLVDRIVAARDLEAVVRDTAESFVAKPAYFLAAMKRLLGHDLAGLKGYLEEENNEILRIRALPEFLERLRGTAAEAVEA